MPTTAAFTAAANTQTGGDVTCPAGMKVLGGGADVGTPNTGVDVNSTFPFASSSLAGAPVDSWEVDVNNTTAAPVPFTVYAICAATN